MRDNRRLRMLAHGAAFLCGCGGATEARSSDAGIDARPADAAPAPPAVWPMFHRTADHAGRSPVPGPQSALVRWKAPLGGPVRASPVIGSDGTVYVGDTKGTLHAIRSDGTVAWQVSLGDAIDSSAVIADGAICVEGLVEANNVLSGSFRCLDAGGHDLWRFAPGTVLWDPTVASDQTLYLGAPQLVALHPDGTMRWAVNLGANAPAILPSDGTIVSSSVSSQVFAYGVSPADGAVRWKTQVDASIGPVSVDSSGVSYATSADSNVYAFGPHGALLWKKLVGGWSFVTPAIASDGMLYVAGPDLKDANHEALLALDPSNGSTRWTFHIGAWPAKAVDLASSPIVGSDGVVYIGGVDDNVYAVAPDGSQKWTLNTGGPIYSTGAIGADGTLYFGSDDGNLYAIGQ